MSDHKPRGVKAPMSLIPWEVVPIECVPPILAAALPSRDEPGGLPYVIAKECIRIAGLEQVARAFEYGAKKYGRNNWQSFIWDRSAVDEYFSAICRHLIAYEGGEERAPDSGVHHLAHVAAGCLIWRWHEDLERD